MTRASSGTGVASVADRVVADRVKSEVAPAAYVHYGSLMWTLARTDFKSRYHGTFGGFVWALLKPLAMFVVLLVVFSFVFVSEPLYRLNLLIGLFLYDFFSESSRAGLASLQAKSHLLSKVRFPSWVVVLASMSNALLTLTVFVVMIVAFQAFTGRPPSLAAVGLFLVYLGCFAAIVVGFSLGASVLFLRYRDLNQVWDLVLQAGFFVAPVIYPLGVIPERYHFMLYFWPPTAVIQLSRTVLVDAAIPTLRAHVYLGFEALVIVGVGALVFGRFARRAAEYL